MATLVLGTVGTLVGGPLGGALGAFLGSRIGGGLFGGSGNDGPRLKELAVTQSTYGQPLARHYGRMRVPGLIIWSSDLREAREQRGGGKGQPKTSSVSYSASFAVAVSSNRIGGIGRIWADGNLLRGAAGDLKTGGSLRIYTGAGDQAPDPLLQSVHEAQCPAYRGRAYVVFEDLQLADFGNRIPALSLEVFAPAADEIFREMTQTLEEIDVGSARFAQLQGYSHESGNISQNIAAIGQVCPATASLRDGRVILDTQNRQEPSVRRLPEAAVWQEGERGQRDGRSEMRTSDASAFVEALRYYDVERDFQPGLQRTEAQVDGQRNGKTLEFPGALLATDARELAEVAAQRDRNEGETLTWRLAELDEDIVPGAIVEAPGVAGLWRIQAWEWREAGVELELRRYVPEAVSLAEGVAGTSWSAPDRTLQPTQLRVFELPLEGTSGISTPRRFVAAGSRTGAWSGAALYVDNGGELVPVGEAGPVKSVLATLATSLAGSTALRFEADAVLELELLDHEMALPSTSIAGLARGYNKLLVGSELVQYAKAIPMRGGKWTLRGLLRGRAGSELAARTGHGAGTEVTLIDDTLIPLDPAIDLSGSQSIAAIGVADEEPAFAALENSGASTKPLVPAHPIARFTDDGALSCSWVRRARGAWHWPDGAEVPLVEETEQYIVGIGDPQAPRLLISSSAAEVEISPTQLAGPPGQPVWVRQIGTFAQSDPLLLIHLP